MTNSATAPKERRPFDQMSFPQQAGILCNDDRFREFAAMRCGLPGHRFSTTAATHYLREQCGIESRRELATDPNAQDEFQALLTELDVWIGKQAAPR